MSKKANKRYCSVRASLVALMLAFCLLLSSCDFYDQLTDYLTDKPGKAGQSSTPTTGNSSRGNPDILPPASNPSSVENDISAILEEGHSDYGYNALSSAEQVAYTTIKDAFFALEKEVTIKGVKLESLERILFYMENDYPLLDWVDTKYTYQTTLIDNSMRLIFNYTIEHDALLTKLVKIKTAGDEICNPISSELSDFDKAILSHDALLQRVVYSKVAKNHSEAVGALVDGVTACVGYSKAYQYLLCRLGMDALIIYGQANEAHAWNAVMLRGSYYFADPTWNDADDKEGNSYISHEYTFLSGEQLYKTHSNKDAKWNYPVPECTLTDMNFAAQKGLLCSSSELSEVAQKLDTAFTYALANNNTAMQIRFENKEDFDAVIAGLDNGKLDSMVYEMCEQRSDKKAVARSLNDKLLYLTYIFY